MGHSRCDRAQRRNRTHRITLNVGTMWRYIAAEPVPGRISVPNDPASSDPGLLHFDAEREFVVRRARHAVVCQRNVGRRKFWR